MDYLVVGHKFSHTNHPFFFFLMGWQILKIGLCGLLYRIGATTYYYIPNFLCSNKEL
jgi:hypothetical protein